MQSNINHYDRSLLIDLTSMLPIIMQLGIKGDFGPIYSQFKGKPNEAIEHLLKTKEGEAIGALNRLEIGDIDLVWGKSGEKGYGLSHIIERHGENILKILPAIVEEGDISENVSL